MIAKSYILANLSALQTKFKASKTQKDSLFYSKLAILELCGWIEESMDDVVLTCARARLKDPGNLRFVEKEVIKKTYAFEYEKFRSMLIRLIGLIHVERIESKMDASLRPRFEAALEALKIARNAEAHTHIKGVTRTINAPSVTIAHFHDVYAGLKHMDDLVRTAKI
jgi:hypothetical protein